MFFSCTSTIFNHKSTFLGQVFTSILLCDALATDAVKSVVGPVQFDNSENPNPNPNPSPNANANPNANSNANPNPNPSSNPNPNANPSPDANLNPKFPSYLELVTHTSGLPRLHFNMADVDAKNPYAKITVEQVVDALERSLPTSIRGAKNRN
jgi:hypothetical protein